MPEPSPTTAGATRLANEVFRARIARGISTQKALANAIGVSARLIGEIENARRESYAKSTLAKLESALGWAEGSAAAMLAGGDATPRGGAGGPVAGSGTRLETPAALETCNPEATILDALGRPCIKGADGTWWRADGQRVKPELPAVLIHAGAPPKTVVDPDVFERALAALTEVYERYGDGYLPPEEEMAAAVFGSISHHPIVALDRAAISDIVATHTLDGDANACSCAAWEHCDEPYDERIESFGAHVADALVENLTPTKGRLR